MEPRNPPGFWFKSDFAQSPLREPRMKSSEASKPDDQADGTTEEARVGKRTVLRAEAPEFVPMRRFEQQMRGLSVDSRPAAPRPSVQNRLNRAKTSHQNTQDFSPGTSSYASLDPEQAADPSTDLARLRQLIASLVNYPGQFDDLLMVFLETTCPYFDDPDALEQIAQILVGEAVHSPNFRYNGVRLCASVERQRPQFGDQLFEICEQELESGHNQQNVMLFIAELYTQLTYFTNFGYLLIYAARELLLVGGNDNVKCVCQALKLTGHALERTQPKSFNELFSQLESSASSLSGSALALLNSVINLKQSNWGRSATESTSSEVSDCDHDHDYEQLVTGILYEAEGQTLTSEEQEFLAAQDEYLSDSDDPDALCDPEPEMDDEIQAAFEEFVKLNKH